MSTAAEKTPEPKAEYHSPTLIVYGTIRDITQNSGSRGKNDGGSGPRKTGF
jgi:hypothetical protein